MNLLKAAFSISAMTLLSRITGLLREVVGANLVGAGAAMDAFQVAWRIPNFLRRLFAEGAFTQAFVPVFAEARNQRGEAETRLLADHVASLLAVILLVVTVIGVIAAPVLVTLTASGFAKDAGKFDLTVQMVRVTFPYIFFISLVSCAAGILNTYSRFKVPAFTPVLLNIAVIATALWAAPYFDPPVKALAWGTLLGGVLQLAFQFPALKRIGMLPRFRWRPRDEGVQRILRLMVPAAFGVSVAHVSILINTQIASFLGDGAVSWISYADRLMEFPSAMLGVALGTVLLPSLVKHHAEDDPEEYSRLLDWGLRVTLMLTLPAALALALLATPLIATLFHRGEFLARDVLMVKPALIAYALGLTGIILVKVLAPAFYARQNIKTPVKIAVATLIATQLFNLAFVPLFRHAGLTLAIGLGACANAALLYIFIRRQRIHVPQPEWPVFLLKLSVALYAMGGVLWSIAGTDDIWLQASTWTNCLRLAVVVIVGGATYFASLWLMGFRPADFARRAA